MPVSHRHRMAPTRTPLPPPPTVPYFAVNMKIALVAASFVNTLAPLGAMTCRGVRRRHRTTTREGGGRHMHHLRAFHAH